MPNLAFKEHNIFIICFIFDETNDKHIVFLNGLLGETNYNNIVSLKGR